MIAPTAPARRRRRAFTMIEILFILGLLVMAAAVGGQLFVSTIRLGHSTSEAQNQAATIESMIGMLGVDAWGATEIRPDGSTVELRYADASPVTWTSSEGTLLRQSEGSPDRRWNLAADATFDGDETTLIVRLGSSKHVRGGEIHLVSQVRLLGRMNK